MTQIVWWAVEHAEYLLVPCVLGVARLATIAPSRTARWED